MPRPTASSRRRTAPLAAPLLLTLFGAALGGSAHAACTPLAGSTALAAPASGQVLRHDLAPYPYPAQQCTDVQPQADGSRLVTLQTTEALSYQQAGGLRCGDTAFGLQGGPIRRASQASGPLFNGVSASQPVGQWPGQTLLLTDGLQLQLGDARLRVDTDLIALPSRTTLAADGSRETVVDVPAAGIPVRVEGQPSHFSAGIWQCLAGSATSAAGADRVRYQAAPPSTSQRLACGAYQGVDVPGLGRLVNNTWNAAAASSWQQCLSTYGSGAETQFGWQWSWPRVSAPSVAIYAYPELVVGAKPWDPGPGNDARFPRRVADTRHLRIAYQADTRSDGPYNTATSLWLIRTPTVAAVPDLSTIRTEIMVWTESVGGLNPGGTLRGEITLSGRVWEVWVAERWGQTTAPAGTVWTYVAYRAKVSSPEASFDAREFIADAVARGLASNDLYVASVELGNEVAGGSGSLRLQAFSITID